MGKKNCSEDSRDIRKSISEIRTVANTIRSNARNMNYTSPSEADVLDNAVAKIENLLKQKG